MKKIRATVTGVGGYVPDFVLDNKKLEKMVDTNDEWITDRTGIKERRILKGEDKGTSDMAIPAVQELLRKTNTKAEEVDLLICCTTTPDMQFPATANVICAASWRNKFFRIRFECRLFRFFIWFIYRGAVYRRRKIQESNCGWS